MPDFRFDGAGSMAVPLDFKLPEAYGRYLASQIWRQTGQEIKANWDKYPTSSDLLNEQQKFW